jgi:putative CocE/NonD family hydrolase
MLRKFPGAALPAVLLLLCALPCFAADSDKPAYDVREHYTKYEYKIPMRDGVKLFTAVFVPKDQSQAWPFLINRTPYSIAPYGVENYPLRLSTPELTSAGYIFVRQDVRGRNMSEGVFVEETPYKENKGPKDVDETTDMHDTVDWLLKNVANNNGNVGIMGISYPGFYTAASIIDSHPAIKAASPQAPMVDLYHGDDAYHGGAFMLAGNFGFYSFFQAQKNPTTEQNGLGVKFGTSDGYEFYLHAGSIENLERTYLKGANPLWNDQAGHSTFDSYWKERDLAPRMKNVHCAVLTVGGWFDAEDLQGPLSLYKAVGHLNPNTVNLLVEGPWVHGGWAALDGHKLGNVDFAQNTGEFFRAHILLPFFEKYLKGKQTEELPKAFVFETGTNVWRKYDAWPPAKSVKRMLYLQAKNGLSFEAPAGAAGFDEYVSDPARPVPYVGYETLDVPQEYMVSDQRFAQTRPDVLTYESEVLEQDVTVAGPVAPKLFVSTTGTDSDFVVKLIDVYPQTEPEEKHRHAATDVSVPETDLAGWEQLIRGEPMRGKFRHSFEKPEPFTPGKVEEIDFTMPDINHTFRRGHRIMVQVQSSWFPLVDRNPQTFVDIPKAKPEDFRKATERVYHEQGHASGIEVQVLER